jgi:hypothetical protein
MLRHKRTERLLAVASIDRDRDGLMGEELECAAA